MLLQQSLFSDKEIVPPRIDGKRSFLDVLVDHE